MKVFPRNIKHLLAVAALVSSSLPGFLDGGEIVHAQTERQLPSQIEADKTPPDITITSGVALVAGTGDFNGDGADDFLVRYQGSVGDDTQTIVFFKFGIIFGKRNQSQPITINLATDEPDLSLTTKLKPPVADSEITPLGDLNGDGVDDIGVIQAIPTETGQLRDRRLKVIFGSSNLRPGTVDLDALQPDLTIMFDTNMLAPWVAGVADVNGDGAKDLLLTYIDNSNSFAVPILFGPFTPGETIDLSLQQPDVIILANNRVDFVTGVFLADVNGDRITDVLIKKSRLEPQFGSFFFTSLDVVFGSENLQARVEVSISDGQADATVGVGIDFPVISTGDVNADGIDDILIGVPAYSGEPFPPDWFSGSVSIILGYPSMRGTVNQADVFISGLPRPLSLKPRSQTTLGDRLGESMAVSDINGDGVSDILIGAPGLTSDKKGRITYLSRAHIILGSTEITHGTRIQTALNQQDITISFDSKTSGVGHRVSSGDFNGDGVADILVGSDAVSYIFFGGPLRPPEITKAKYHSDASELVVFGTDLTGLARVEVNGVLVDREVTFELDEGRLVVQGLKSELNLRSGKNQIAVMRKGSRSNTVKLKL